MLRPHNFFGDTRYCVLYLFGLLRKPVLVYNTNCLFTMRNLAANSPARGGRGAGCLERGVKEGRSAEPAAGHEWNRVQDREQDRASCRIQDTDTAATRCCEMPRRYVLFFAPDAARSTLGVFLVEPTPDFGRYGRIVSIAPPSLESVLFCRRCANGSDGGSCRRGEGRSHGSQMHGAELGGGTTRIWAQRNEMRVRILRHVTYLPHDTGGVGVAKCADEMSAVGVRTCPPLVVV